MLIITRISTISRTIIIIAEIFTNYLVKAINVHEAEVEIILMWERTTILKIEVLMIIMTRGIEIIIIMLVLGRSMMMIDQGKLSIITISMGQVIRGLVHTTLSHQIWMDSHWEVRVILVEGIVGQVIARWVPGRGLLRMLVTMSIRLELFSKTIGLMDSWVTEHLADVWAVLI